MTEPQVNPFETLGGADAIRALVERFYDVMDEREPALAQLHQLDEHGKVSRRSRDRFALFLIGWLGGPQDYSEQHGHPRLRMRHGKVRVDEAMRDAWLRCMAAALDEREVDPATRAFVDRAFAHTADFLRNVPGAAAG